MKSHGTITTFNLPLYSDFVSEFSELERIVFPSAHTILLIVADAREISVDTISAIAQRYIETGLIYVCVWGPDCDRVHVVFDEVCVGDGCEAPNLSLMTTSHDNESLEDAVWYFLHCAFPLDEEIHGTSYVAITVGETSWANTIDKALSDIPAFDGKVLENENSLAAEEFF